MAKVYNNSPIVQIPIKAQLIATLNSYNDWFNTMPECLPERKETELRLYIDKNGNALSIGKDFRLAEENNTFPVSVYRLQRVSEVYN